MTNLETTMIQLSDVSYTYPLSHGSGIKAIRDLSLKIREGEFIAVIGQNGSGKSTFGKLLNALLIPDSGEVMIAGMNTKDLQKHTAIRSLVGMVFQRPQDQIVSTIVAEDVAFGPSNLGLEPREIRRRVEEALAVVGLSGYEERPSYLLSAGETQRLALAGVLAMKPSCVIFDETTSMLDPLGREMVMQQAKALRAQGITILFITHLMEEAAQADRVIALHNGRLAMEGVPTEVFASRQALQKIGLDQPEAMFLGEALRPYIPSIPSLTLTMDELISSIPKRRKTQDSTSLSSESFAKPAQGEEVIIVEGLAHTYLRDTPLAHQSLDNVNLLVSRGSVHGLLGATGSGKSTLLQHLNALICPQRGRVTVLGEDLGSKSLNPKELRRQVGLSFQQAEDYIFEQYVGDEVAFAAKNFGIEGKLIDVVREAMEAVGLDFNAFKDRFTSTLSGGELRKVALASALAGQPRVLLLDEPLAGLDPQSRVEISAHLKGLNDGGMTLVISSHQFDDLLEIIGEVSVLDKGNDVLSGSAEDVFGNAHQLEGYGFKPPAIFMLSQVLREKGWLSAVGVKNVGQLITSLQAKTESVAG